MKRLELDVDSFEEIVKTRLLVRCLVERPRSLGQGACKTTIHLYTVIRGEVLGEVIYTHREQGDWEFKFEPWTEATRPLECREFGAPGSQDCRKRIQDILGDWASPHMGARLWLRNQAEYACREREVAGLEPIPVSEFHLLQHYVRLHTKIAFDLKSRVEPSMWFFLGFECRLWPFIRQQNALWERTVGLVPYSHYWRHE